MKQWVTRIAKRVLSSSRRHIELFIKATPYTAAKWWLILCIIYNVFNWHKTLFDLDFKSFCKLERENNGCLTRKYHQISMASNRSSSALLHLKFKSGVRKRQRVSLQAALQCTLSSFLFEFEVKLFAHITIWKILSQHYY